MLLKAWKKVREYEEKATLPLDETIKTKAPHPTDGSRKTRVSPTWEEKVTFCTGGGREDRPRAGVGRKGHPPHGKRRPSPARPEEKAIPRTGGGGKDHTPTGLHENRKKRALRPLPTAPPGSLGSSRLRLPGPCISSSSKRSVIET